ncbi:MAG: hypothetical protein GF334_07770 [Candidatus Altiarchaeales archaeon]|nr:hypothetical protein [Candidatus Altiarchaeales archaeon]
MPHKCAYCSKIIKDSDPQLMAGCECGSRVFLYLRGDYKDSVEDTIDFLKEKKLNHQEKKWIETEFEDRLKAGDVISLDIENILQLSDGKFILDLHSLMKGEPVVIKEEGVYYIDLQYAMRKKGEKSR